MASQEEVQQIEIFKQMQLWKESINHLTILLGPFKVQESDLSSDAGSP